MAEPRARAGKNVGKMNFTANDLSLLLYGFGDVRQPLPETVRVLDEILTDFIQAVAFEANRCAHHAGRQKIKVEDFQFAFRKNPAFIGKIQEFFEKKQEIDKARKTFKDDETALVREAAADEAARESREKEKAERAASGQAFDEEVLGEEDDDAEAEADILKKR